MHKFYKILKWLVVVIISLFIIDAAVVLFFSFYRPVIQQADAVVILGAAINTPALYNRTLTGLKLYQDGKAPLVVLSGGVDYPKSISEASYMENVILASATTVPPTIMEQDSHSTYENLLNTKAVLSPKKSIIIVSDSFHLARAVLTAKSLGFSPVTWTSPKPSYYNPRELSYYYLREMLAMVDYLPKFILAK